MKTAFFCLGALFLFLAVGAEMGTNTPSATPALAQDPGTLQGLVDAQVVAAAPSVFDGDQFPAIDFINKDLVQRAIGPYNLKVRFFDSAWREVTAPATPGRYGALVEIKFADGVSGVRHLTLFRTTGDYAPARDPYHASLTFPEAFAIPAAVAQSESWNVDEYANDSLELARQSDPGFAVFVAALHDIAADPARFRGFEFYRIDDMWWQELEKRLGLAKPYPRLVHLPEGYAQAPEKKWPLILFLHGSGERGDDLDVLKTEGPGAYADKGHPLPFLVVTPLCPNDESWTPALLWNLLQEIEKSYRVDSSRIYLTGLSMGGIGAIELAATYPGEFAAMAPLSSREDPEIALRLQHIPTWFFHGSDDDIVPTRYAEEMAAALKKEGGPVKLTILPGVGHGGWDDIYANPELYAWFLRYRR
jgi:predicted esterase